MTPAGNITPRPANLTTMPTQPCPGCGTLTTTRRCPACQARHPDPRPNAHRRGYTRQWRRKARRLYDQPCHWCGAPADTADHLTPKAKGGTDHPDNLVPACRSCNSSRRDRGGTPATARTRSPETQRPPVSQFVPLENPEGGS